MGDIFQYFFSCVEHPKFGCEADIETPVESEPKKDILVPAQILLPGVFVKLASVALFICIGYALE